MLRQDGKELNGWIGNQGRDGVEAEQKASDEQAELRIEPLKSLKTRKQTHKHKHRNNNHISILLPIPRT
jgi:hypothetical protein